MRITIECRTSPEVDPIVRHSLQRLLSVAYAKERKMRLILILRVCEFASLRVFIIVSRNPAESSCVNDEIEPKDRDGWQSNHAGRINQILSRKTLQTL